MFSWPKLLLLAVGIMPIYLSAQKDSSLIWRKPADSSKNLLNQDAIYNRPFLNAGNFPVALGGYAEMNSSYFATDGITEGLSFQFPRMTLFVSSTIKKRIRFLSEIEFEEGGREINLEFAALDIELHPLAILRGGIIMNPIGAFNQNHDGPKWEFVDRPLSATLIIPSTWSNTGAGIYGKTASKNLIWGYEAYLTNGFDNTIISNGTGRTFLAASKRNPERFEESYNGIPLVTLKTSIRNRKIGELGVSWMGGVYNKFREDGLVLDKRRRTDVFAVDFNTVIPKLKTSVIAEAVVAMTDIPETYTQHYGERQAGFFIDLVQPLVRKRILGWENSSLNLAFRFEYVDLNVGRFRETGGLIGDEILAFSPGISFRPGTQTVIRFNYRRIYTTDILGNPPANTAGFQLGFSSYF